MEKIMRMCVQKSEVANINTRLHTGLLALLILSESARKLMHPKLSLNNTSNMLKNISRIKTYCVFSYFTTMLMSKIKKKNLMPIPSLSIKEAVKRSVRAEKQQPQKKIPCRRRGHGPLKQHPTVEKIK